MKEMRLHCSQNVDSNTAIMKQSAQVPFNTEKSTLWPTPKKMKSLPMIFHVYHSTQKLALSSLGEYIRNCDFCTQEKNIDIYDKKENLEATMLSEINKAQKDKYCITLLECESEKAKFKSEE